MERTESITAHKRTPQGEARAEVQRKRILAAAKKCFVEYGFHAASMASIAETADMSAGLIYRYFESKDAIVLAIIEQQLHDNRASIAKLQSSRDLVAGLQDLFARCRSDDLDTANPVLILEMTAQASRDPRVAEALVAADRLLQADISAWLLQASRNEGREMTAQEIRARQFILQCFVEGMFVRVVREPDFDPGLLAEGLHLFLHQVLVPDEPAGNPLS